MIETLEEKNKWIDFLQTLSKDELIDFIMNDSFYEFRTDKLLQLRFGSRYSVDDVDKLLDNYRGYVEAFAYCKEPDINHITRMTWILIDLADKEYADYRTQILTEVRKMMGLLPLNGVGMENDEDFVFTIIREHVDKLLRNNVSE